MKDVFLRITRVRHKSVFKNHNFHFEREKEREVKDTCWSVWIGTERSDPYFPGVVSTSNNFNRMWTWVKSGFPGNGNVHGGDLDLGRNLLEGM